MGAVGGGRRHDSGDFELTAGEVLQIVVGGVGQTTPSSGGGGGGSFVIGPMNKPLVIAGGGGAGSSSKLTPRPDNPVTAA